MSTMDASDLRQRLDEVLARAANGERIVVRSRDGAEVVIGPSPQGRTPQRSRVHRRRHSSRRTVAEVLGEDRGA